MGDPGHRLDRLHYRSAVVIGSIDALGGRRASVPESAPSRYSGARTNCCCGRTRSRGDHRRGASSGCRGWFWTASPRRWTPCARERTKTSARSLMFKQTVTCTVAGTTPFAFTARPQFVP